MCWLPRNHRCTYRQLLADFLTIQAVQCSVTNLVMFCCLNSDGQIFTAITLHRPGHSFCMYISSSYIWYNIIWFICYIMYISCMFFLFLYFISQVCIFQKDQSHISMEFLVITLHSPFSYLVEIHKMYCIK